MSNIKFVRQWQTGNYDARLLTKRVRFAITFQSHKDMTIKRALALLMLTLLPPLSLPLSADEENDYRLYLLTVDPGVEIYSIYGHSALRLVNESQNYDQVFNWGVFDFSTPNFAYRFIKGRLDYMLIAYSYNRFLAEYTFEERDVHSQEIFLTADELEKLIELVEENLKPENVKYRYDFFYDNCATRIRDILVDATAGRISLERAEEETLPTFRDLLSIYQSNMRWLDLGIDMLLGMPADKRADESDQMFLPDYLMYNLTSATILREGVEMPLLSKPTTVLRFESSATRTPLLLSPGIILSALLVLTLLISVSKRLKGVRAPFDLTITGLFSLLALLIWFVTFFTDHDATGHNLNTIWANPLIILSFIALFIRKSSPAIHRINLSVITIFLVAAPFLPQAFNPSMLPLVLILLVRLWFLGETGIWLKRRRSLAV